MEFLAENPVVSISKNKKGVPKHTFYLIPKLENTIYLYPIQPHTSD